MEEARRTNELFAALQQALDAEDGGITQEEYDSLRAVFAAGPRVLQDADGNTFQVHEERARLRCLILDVWRTTPTGKGTVRRFVESCREHPLFNIFYSKNMFA